MALSPRRRVSYVLPPPTEPVPRLHLPPPGVSRFGCFGPLLLPTNSLPQPEIKQRAESRHPRHRLGIAGLALDASTLLARRSSPEGILYTGGRDGLIISWDLCIPTKQRSRWEAMMRWEDEEKKDDDGDLLGDVGSLEREGKMTGDVARDDDIPHDRQWETDVDAFVPSNVQPARFRQCIQSHTEQINDILLCNYNQTVVSASSDGTVKAWNPHSQISQDPWTIGRHDDYAQCLAHSREQNWVASGSFDRSIKLWDLTQTLTPASATTAVTPLITLNPPDTSSSKSSMYALAADPLGHMVASESPESVVTIWDPRSGKKAGKLVGHTDRIRTIVVSEDARYLLTGSADASIKLWSLASQRCLHTFTHHIEPVWSLFSSHPSLEIFYSSDKSGLVCKVDIEDCSDVSEGECIVLCRDTSDCSVASADGIRRIVAMDDSLLWMVSGDNSSIKRWRSPQRRVVRAKALIQDMDSSLCELPVQSRKKPSDPSHTPTLVRHDTFGSLSAPQNMTNLPLHIRPDSDAPFATLSAASETQDHRDKDREDSTLYGIPYDSLVKLTSPGDPLTPYLAVSQVRDRAPPVAPLRSAASVMPVPHTATSRSSLHSTVQQIPRRTNMGTSSRREVTTGCDAIVLLTSWGSGEEQAQPVNTARAQYEEREVAADAIPLYPSPDEIIEGDHGLVRSIVLNDRMHALTVDTLGQVAVWELVRGICLGRYSPEDVAQANHVGGANRGDEGDKKDREANAMDVLEAVRKRIEGEAVVVPWSSVDTKTGVLAVHIMERCFEAEIYPDECGFKPKKPDLRLNLGEWVLRNLFVGFIGEEERMRRNPSGNTTPQPDTVHQVDYLHLFDSNASNASSSAKPSMRRNPSSPTVISSPTMIPAIMPDILIASKASPRTTPMIFHPVVKGMQLLSPVSMPPGHLQLHTPDNGHLSTNKDSEYTNADMTRQASILSPGTTKERSPSLGPNSPGRRGGLISRWKSFGIKKTNDAVSNPLPSGAGSNSLAGPSVEDDAGHSHHSPAPKTPLQLLLAGPLTPPPSKDAPTLHLSPHISLVISEEDILGWTTIYCGTIATSHIDVRALEETMPMWLLEYLLTNKFPALKTTKFCFVMLPWPSKNPNETLPLLLNTTTSKLAASRYVRIRQVKNYVQQHMDRLGGVVNPEQEDLYEILCNDVVLPLDMTLAAVQQFVWKQAAGLILHYRKRIVTSTPTAMGRR